MSVVCVLGALAVGCATGADIGDHVQLIEFSPEALALPGAGLESNGGAATPELGAEARPDSTPEAEAGGVQRSSSEAEGAGAELPLAPGDPTEAEPESADPAEDDEPSSSPASPGPGSSAPNPPVTPPPVAATPAGVAPAPTAPPASVPGNTAPPSIPGLGPDVASAPTLPAEGPCLAGWEGSSCDTCSGQTQSDRLACRLYIDCYLVNDCDPGSCGNVEQVCGVNRIGNGLAPKEIADAVYSCRCAP